MATAGNSSLSNNYRTWRTHRLPSLTEVEVDKEEPRAAATEVLAAIPEAEAVEATTYSSIQPS